jgi:hypothetical protein
MQKQAWRFPGAVIAVVIIALFAMHLTTVAAAQTDPETLRAIFASAPKEDTNVPGVRIFAAPPKDFNPFTASNEALATYGLPPRPSKATEPGRYSVWEMAMLAAKHRASPSQVKAMPYSSTNLRLAGAPLGPKPAAQTPTTSFNWSGVAITNALKKWSNAKSFVQIESVFNVPVAQPPFYACYGPYEESGYYEVSWNGIDGFFPNTSVVQGGSASNAFCYQPAQYFAWVEWWPSFPILQVFPVNPGDDMYVITYGASGINPQFVFVEDLTLQVWGTFQLVWQNGPGLIGNSAEFIVERPSDTEGHYLPLANTIYDFFNYDFAQNGVKKIYYAGSTAVATFNIAMVDNHNTQQIEYANSSQAPINLFGNGAGLPPGNPAAVGGQGSLPLWFVTINCAYNGGCVP